VTKTIAVTGATGFIGSAVIRRLAAMPDHRIVALCRVRPAASGHEDIRWIESALEELRPSHWEVPGATSLDAVLHLAAFTPKRSADRDRADEIIRTNIVGLQALLASLRHPPRRLVFGSTLDVYAPAAFDGVVDERSPVGPVGLYGLSKLFGEGLVASYARAAGVEHVTLRIGHVYGPGEERYAKLIPETIRRLLAGAPPRVSGDGQDRRDLLYVDDAAEALVRACVAPLGGVNTINLARGESHSIAEVVTLLAGCVGYDGPLERMPASAGAHSTVFDTTLMRRVLGPLAFTPLRDGLTREMAHARAATA
jgi:UDP-glucose 4-epimerase